jgi:hypothetical protein
MVVMDVKGAGLSHLSGDVLVYLKSAGDINNSHYPLSLKRAFAVNSPFWLAGAWSSIKGILPDSVQVDILSSHQFLRALRERIDDDQIPPEYGGSSPYKLGEHPFEKELYELVEQASTGTNDDDDNDDNYASDQKFKDSDTGTKHAVSDQDASSQLLDKKTSAAPARRRRDQSHDDPAVRSSIVSFDVDIDNDDKKNAAVNREGREFMKISATHSLAMIVAGMVETTVPLWILVPTELGGLGYAPSRSGVALFCSSIVLLWAAGTWLKKILSTEPYAAPLRSFRIGIGWASMLLMLIAVIPKTVSPEKRTNSILVMALTIIFLSCMVLSSLFARVSSGVLHHLASATFAKSEHVSTYWIGRYYGNEERLINDCESGKLSAKIGFVSELIGVMVVAPIYSWSLAQQQPSSMDGTLCLYLSALLAFVIYICSFSINLHVGGDFSLHSREKGHGSDSISRRCLSFLYEVISVSVSDMASLFDEANWSVSPLLGRHGTNGYISEDETMI